MPKDAFEKERSRLEGAFSTKGQAAKQLINALKQLMWTKAGVIRRQSGLEEAIKQLQDPWPLAAVASPVDLIRLLEFQNMRCVAELVCRAALERTESRGSHFRSDYSEEDNRRWLKNIVLRKSDTGNNLEVMPVGLDLAELDG